MNGKEWKDLNEPFELGFTPDYSTTKVSEMNGRDIIRLNYTADRMELYIFDTENSRDKYRVSVSFGQK